MKKGGLRLIKEKKKDFSENNLKIQEGHIWKSLGKIPSSWAM